MTLEEMITIGMGKALDDYASQNGVYDTSRTIRQDNEWVSLMRDMANLMEEIIQNNNLKVEKIELPMPYVLTMLDALQAIKKHKLYCLMGDDEEEVKDHIEVVIEEFLEPIAMSENTDAIEIVFYDISKDRRKNQS